ncbi:MAG: aldehyde dehydrogenase family protein, partial [Candidatus Eisenbacteria bacterium]
MTSESRVVRSPWSGDEVGRVVDAEPAQLDAVAAAAVRGFAAWRATPAWRRAEALAAIAAGLRADREGFARSIALEAAKPIRDARTEVDRAAHTFALAAGEATRMAGEWLPLDTLPGNEGKSALVRRVPVGPVLGITPFNFPLNLVAHKVAPALAAGASIVIKPAPQTPLVAQRLRAVATAAGVAEDVFAVVPVANEHARHLVEDERFAVLSFTGSPGVGWALKGRAGKKRVLLELGGNAAAIVHADADVEAAVARAIVGGFAYS